MPIFSVQASAGRQLGRRPFWGTRPLLMAGMLVLLGAGHANAQGSWKRPDPLRREALQHQQAEALARLSASQRRDYFLARRDLVRRSSERHLDQLAQAERCMEQARAFAAFESCQRILRNQRLQERRQRKADWRALRVRFGLPGMADIKG